MSDVTLFTLRPINSLMRDRAEAALTGTGCYSAPAGNHAMAVCCSGYVSPAHREERAERARAALESARPRIMVWPD